jgi:hypothetical protein
MSQTLAGLSTAGPSVINSQGLSRSNVGTVIMN